MLLEIENAIIDFEEIYCIKKSESARGFKYTIIFISRSGDEFIHHFYKEDDRDKAFLGVLNFFKPGTVKMSLEELKEYV